MPENKRLIAMVEGNADEKFIDEIVKPILLKKNRYKDVVPYKYARKTKMDNNKFIDVVKSLNDDILCFGDIDSAPSVTAKKQKLQLEKVGNIGDDCIIVVIKEIESWYLASADRTCCRRLNVRFYERTDSVGK